MQMETTFFWSDLQIVFLSSVFISDQGRKLILKLNKQDRNINDTYTIFILTVILMYIYVYTSDIKKVTKKEKSTLVQCLVQ